MMDLTVRRVATFLRLPWWISMEMVFLVGWPKLTARWPRFLTSLPRGPSTVTMRVLMPTLTVTRSKVSKTVYAICVLIVPPGSERWTAVDEDESEVKSLRCCASIAMVANCSIPAAIPSIISPNKIVQSQAGISCGGGRCCRARNRQFDVHLKLFSSSFVSSSKAFLRRRFQC